MGRKQQSAGSLSPVIRHVSLAGFLQLLEIEKQSCLIQVLAPFEGRIYIEKGVVIGAENSRHFGIEAALNILKWTAPKFCEEDLPSFPAQCRISVSHLIMEAAKRKDEESSNKDIPFEQELQDSLSEEENEITATFQELLIPE